MDDDLLECLRQGDALHREAAMVISVLQTLCDSLMLKLQQPETKAPGFRVGYERLGSFQED